MDKLTVTLSEMTTAARQIQRAKDDFLQAVDLLKQETANLSSTWEGYQHDNFVKYMAYYDQCCRQLATLVQDDTDILQKARTMYEDTDREAALKIAK